MISMKRHAGLSEGDYQISWSAVSSEKLMRSASEKIIYVAYPYIDARLPSCECSAAPRRPTDERFTREPETTGPRPIIAAY